MSVHQTYDGRWICTYKDADNKRRDKSFGRGPNAEASAKAFDEAMIGEDDLPAGFFISTGVTLIELAEEAQVFSF